jgi:uncharacterized protein YndB with AHSA1/START domain
MRFTSAISINAPSRKVWNFVSSPEVWSIIWAKAGKCEQVSPEGGEVGSLYDMELQQGPNVTILHGEIVGLCPGSMIAVRWTMGHDVPYLSRKLTYHFTYELNDDGFGTKVTERFEMTGFGVPIDWAAKLVGWLTYPFQWLARNTCLQRLKRVVEGTDGRYGQSRPCDIRR